MKKKTNNTNYMQIEKSRIMDSIDYEWISALDSTNSIPGHSYDDFDNQNRSLIKNIYVQAVFAVVYLAIFIIGLGGNLMVFCSVFRQRSMQTVTNILIGNLALANILLCIFNLPIMPVQLLVGYWPFGSVMCHLTPCIVGAAVFASTLSLASIAVHRYLVIVHPLKEQINNRLLILIIIGMWIVSIAVSVPNGVYHQLEEYNMVTCTQMWPHIIIGLIYLVGLLVAQFVIPYAIIIYCYSVMSSRMKIADKSKTDGAEEFLRNRRTNRLLIVMTVTFGMCWLPLQISDLIVNVSWFTHWQYTHIEYSVINVIALSSTSCNPLFYKWLNNITNKQLCQVGPCFRHHSRKQKQDDDLDVPPSRDAPVDNDPRSDAINNDSSI